MLPFSLAQQNSLKPLFGVALVLMLMTSAQAEAQSNSVLIRNVQIVSSDKHGLPHVSPRQDVLVRDGVIRAIGKKLGRADGADGEIDGRGQYLTPGLIDSHVHLEGVPGYTAERSEDAAMLEEARAQIPRSYLYFGFTTVLDLTGDHALIAKWNAQEVAPKAYFCAPVIIPNGYPAVWMDKDAQFQVRATKYMLFDPQQHDVYPANFQKEVHTPQAVVALAKADGASCIKVFYETGFGPKKNLPVPTVALIQEVVTQARSLGLPVYLHGNSQASYEFALKAGVSTLVHGMWHADKKADPETNLQSAGKIAAELVKAGIAIQPTVQVLYGEHEMFNPAYFKDEKVQQAIPAKLALWYQGAAGQWMKNRLAEEFSPELKDPQALYQEVKTMYQKPLATVRRMTQKLDQGGARLLFGSDTPSGPFYTQFPGVNGRSEMDRWLETGISLAHLFSALTSDNARALGLEKTLGRVEPNMQANLLLLGANPLSQVGAYDQIRWVMVNGRVHQRGDLAATRNP